MDRLAELISKLNEEFAQNALPLQLLQTTQQIEGELSRLLYSTGKALGTAKVSVVMPSRSRPIERTSHPDNGLIDESMPVFPEKNGANGISKKQDQNGWLFDPMTEIPTLSHQSNGKELNESMAKAESSLNDKLKADIVEVGHLLNDSPVRDLKKAIGINDRFVFISELFRGDETMYERSIKTINSFRIFPEAEYWIERELKVKLGWEDSKDCTRQFYQLVKRRFS